MEAVLDKTYGRCKMENANLIKRFRDTYTDLSAKMNDDEVLHWLEHHDEEYEYLVQKLQNK
jgi:hypothetical protein